VMRVHHDQHREGGTWAEVPALGLGWPPPGGLGLAPPPWSLNTYAKNL